MKESSWAGGGKVLRMIRLLAAVLFALCVLLGTSDAVSAYDVDLWAKILDEHTRSVDDIAGTRADYAALRDSPDLQALMASLDQSDPEQLRSREEQLAFWINAYNILAIDLVARHYPVDGIKEIGSWLRPVWKIEAGRIGGRSYSLDAIEHKILRPLGDPRIHGAVVCASASCPPLRREPYRGERLDVQLDDNVSRWLADPRKGLRIDHEQKRVYLSPIFDWFAADFESAGGVLGFVAEYAPETERQWLERYRAQAEIAWLDYDWSLNDLGRIDVPTSAPASSPGRSRTSRAAASASDLPHPGAYRACRETRPCTRSCARRSPASLGS